MAGNVTHNQVKELSEKWFGDIPAGNKKNRNLTQEKKQTSKRTLTVDAKVPADALYKTYHMPGRFHHDYYAVDLLSDILSRGHSSRLYKTLVKEKEIFTSLSSYVTGSIDPGLLVISGRLREGKTLAEAEQEVDKIIQQLLEAGVSEHELEKVKNQAEASIEFGKVEVMNRAMNLAYAALSGDIELINTEEQKINAVSVEDIQRVAKEILKEENSCVLYYKSI